MNRAKPTRRSFLGTLSLGAVAAAAPTARKARDPGKGKAGRPNILIIIADDQTYTDNGCYGNKDVNTPNIDRLARQGMRFTRAFTATAMCAPTRQQLYTGIFPVRNGAYPNHSKVKPGTKSLVHYFKAMGYRVGICGKRHFGPPASFPFQKVEQADMARFISRDKGRPYFLVVASKSPHTPWTEGDAGAYDPRKLTLPPYMVDTPPTRRALCQYYAEVTDFDRQVGHCMDLVRQSGRQDNTIFIYTSEQGAPFLHGKWTCYDDGLRVALVIRWPARVRAGSVANAMVQYVDVVPTLIEAAGGKPIEGLDGRSFLPVLLGKTDEHNDVVFGVHTTRGIIAGSECYPIRSVRTARYKYIRNLNHKTAFRNVLIAKPPAYWRSWVEKAKTDRKAAKLVEMYQHRPAEELYDVIADPHELNNLAGGDAANRELMDELGKRLEAWMAQQGDLGNETERRARQHDRKKRAR